MSDIVWAGLLGSTVTLVGLVLDRLISRIHEERRDKRRKLEDVTNEYLEATGAMYWSLLRLDSVLDSPPGTNYRSQLPDVMQDVAILAKKTYSIEPRLEVYAPASMLGAVRKLSSHIALSTSSVVDSHETKRDHLEEFISLRLDVINRLRVHLKVRA